MKNVLVIAFLFFTLMFLGATMTGCGNDDLAGPSASDPPPQPVAPDKQPPEPDPFDPYADQP